MVSKENPTFRPYPLSPPDIIDEDRSHARRVALRHEVPCTTTGAQRSGREPDMLSHLPGRQGYRALGAGASLATDNLAYFRPREQHCVKAGATLRRVFC